MVWMSSFLPLKANDEVRAATCRPDTFDSAVIRSSVMPSLKYSFSLSELMLTNGSTATDFFAGATAPDGGALGVCGTRAVGHQPSSTATTPMSAAITPTRTPSRRRAGRLPRALRRPLRPRQHHAVHVDRHLDVLQLRLPQAFERLVDLVANLIEHRTGDADAAGVGERLDARGDVDAVAEDVAVAHLDVTEMQADAHLDAPLRPPSEALRSHQRRLNRDGAAHRLQGAARTPPGTRRRWL